MYSDLVCLSVCVSSLSVCVLAFCFWRDQYLVCLSVSLLSLSVLAFCFWRDQYLVCLSVSLLSLSMLAFCFWRDQYFGCGLPPTPTHAAATRTRPRRANQGLFPIPLVLSSATLSPACLTQQCQPNCHRPEEPRQTFIELTRPIQLQLHG